MKHTRTKSELALRAMLVVWALVMFGGESDNARKRVKDGVEAFRKRKYSDAARAFADADVLVPDDLTIKFNRGCAEARIQNREDAKRMFSVASSSTDRKVALAAHYNLGTLEVLEAAQKFGAEPHKLKGTDRDEGVEHLTKAVRHFRNCLVIDPNNMDARKNIEIIRTWHANMRKHWKQQDEKTEEQKQQEKTLPQVLTELDAAQFKAFDATSELAGRNRSSDELKELQQAVAEILPRVEEKLNAAFEQQQQTANEEQREQMEQAREMVMSVFGRIQEAAAEANGRLAEEKIKDAVAQQANVLNGANQLLETISQFPNAVQRSLAVQTALVKRLNSKIVEPRDEAFPIAQGNSFQERQVRVAGLTSDLAENAKRFEATLEQQQQPGARGMPPEQIEGYRTAIERAVELNEELNSEVGKSNEQLESLQCEQAQPHAQRALDILKEIAETLPKSDDQNQQGDQQNQDQEQKDEQDQEDQQDQKNESGDSKDEQKKQDDGEQKQEPQDQKKSAQEERQIRSREEAEAMLRQVRDREQSLKDQQAILRAIRARSKKVKRDW